MSRALTAFRQDDPRQIGVSLAELRFTAKLLDEAWCLSVLKFIESLILLVESELTSLSNGGSHLPINASGLLTRHVSSQISRAALRLTNERSSFGSILKETLCNVRHLCERPISISVDAQGEASPDKVFIHRRLSLSDADWRLAQSRALLLFEAREVADYLASTQEHYRSVHSLKDELGLFSGPEVFDAAVEMTNGAWYSKRGSIDWYVYKTDGEGCPDPNAPS